MMRWRSVVILLFLSVFAGSALGQERSDSFDMGKLQKELRSSENGGGQQNTPETQTQESQEQEEESLLLLILRITGYLAVIIVLIVVIAWMLRRGGLAGSSKIGGGSMDLLEQLPLGQNRSVTLVRVGDAVYVLGQTATNITVLERIEGDKAVELVASTKGVVSVTKFKDAMNVFLNRLKK